MFSILTVPSGKSVIPKPNGTQAGSSWSSRLNGTSACPMLIKIHSQNSVKIAYIVFIITFSLWIHPYSNALRDPRITSSNKETFIQDFLIILKQQFQNYYKTTNVSLVLNVQKSSYNKDN